MKTKVTIKPVYKLTGKEFNEHRRLSFRSNGDLFYKVDEFRYDIRAKVISLRDQDGRLLAWGLIYPSYYTSGKDCEFNLQLYTRASERRKGYGTRILNKAKRSAEGSKFIVFPHDGASEDFFDAYGAKQVSYARVMI